MDRMLRLGASTEMVSRFYGLTHQEVALRRDIPRLPSARAGIRCSTRRRTWPCGSAGRPASPSAGIALDRRHGDAGADHGPGRGLLSLPMSVIWAAIRNWIDQGWCRPWRRAAHHGAMVPVLRCRRCSTRRCGTWPREQGGARRRPVFYSGNRHESVPRALFLDRRLTPLERNAWQVFRLQLNDDGVTAFPTYDQSALSGVRCPCAAQASHETVARALTLLRLTRWLSLVRRRRDPKTGRIQGKRDGLQRCAIDGNAAR